MEDPKRGVGNDMERSEKGGCEHIPWLNECVDGGGRAWKEERRKRSTTKTLRCTARGMTRKQGMDSHGNYEQRRGKQCTNGATGVDVCGSTDPLVFWVKVSSFSVQQESEKKAQTCRESKGSLGGMSWRGRCCARKTKQRVCLSLNGTRFCLRVIWLMFDFR